MLQKGDTIAFDFDGVIHRYSKGWGDGKIYDTPVNGIRGLIYNLRKEGFKVVIYSTRAKSIKGRIAMREWLKKYMIEVDDISKDKPLAKIYIDDRAINFNGNVEKLKKDISIFKPWNDGVVKKCPVCGKEFINDRTTSNRKIYCSSECRILYNRHKDAVDRLTDIRKFYQGKDA